MDLFLLVFIPLFFAMDPIGLLPIYAALTEGLSREEKRVIVLQSLVTATLVAFGFILIGQVVFRLLGISMGDFMVAGGVILFCLAMLELMVGSKLKQVGPTDIGAVPLGTPLVVGPAVLTMALMLVNQHGVLLTMGCVALNILIVAGVFMMADPLMAMVGKNGAKALSKVLALLLAAIGVMMVRRGIMQILASMAS